MALSVVPFTSKETTPLVEFFSSWKKEAEKGKIKSVVVLALLQNPGDEAVGLQIEQAGTALTLVEIIGLFDLAKYDIITSHDPE